MITFPDRLRFFQDPASRLNDKINRHNVKGVFRIGRQLANHPVSKKFHKWVDDSETGTDKSKLNRQGVLGEYQ